MEKNKRLGLFPALHCGISHGQMYPQIITELPGVTVSEV